VPSPPRDKDATWRTLGELCSALGGSRHRLLRELQEGLRYRTIPEGHVIDWHDPNVRRWLNLEASEVSFYDEKDDPAAADDEDEEGDAWPTLRPILRGPISRYLRTTVYIEVWPPGAPADADVPSPAADAPAASPAPPRTVSDKDLRDCILAIVEDHPNDPLEVDSELWPEVERRLGQSVARDRVRAAREKVAPQWVSRRGRPRKPAQ
jgi:hypothetical protein